MIIIYQTRLESMPYIAIKPIIHKLFSVSQPSISTINFIEGVTKMATHVCVELSKNIAKCNCLRKGGRDRADSKDIHRLNEIRRPVWMHSGLSFKCSSGSFENN